MTLFPPPPTRLLVPAPQDGAPSAFSLDFSGTEELWRLYGAEAQSFLNSYNTQDCKNLSPRQAAYGAFLTQKGKLVTDAWILRLPEEFLLLLPAGYGEKLARHLTIYLDFAEVTLEPAAEWGHFGLFGAQASSVLEKILGTEIEKNAVNQTLSLQELSWRGESLWLFTSERWGQKTWDILLPTRLQAEWSSQLQAQTQALPLELLSLFRIEAGLPRMGLEMGEDNLVAEVGLDETATSFSKGCYLGQETTARVRSQGRVNRRLQRVELTGWPSASAPAKILLADKPVGELCSWTYSLAQNKILGLAMLPTRAEPTPEAALRLENSEIRVQTKPKP